MNLCEEYLQRHGITVPVARHIDRGTLFFRSETDSRIVWQVLYIQNVPDSSHPSKYSFMWLAPVYNGLSDKIEGKKSRVDTLGMFAVVDGVSLEWDQYENYCLEWCEGEARKDLVMDEVDVYLTAWEIYAYCFDRELSKFSDQESLHKSLSLSLTPLERLQGCSEIVSFLSKNYPRVMEGWQAYMLPLVKQYCFWLVALTGKKVLS